MRPQDIENIANGVVNAFSKPVSASAGCMGFSDANPFSCETVYTCPADYECGGAAAFNCVIAFSGEPVCEEQFTCGRGIAYYTCDSLRLITFEPV